MHQIYVPSRIAFHRQEMAKNTIGITVGDVLKKKDATTWIWEVDSIFVPIGHRPHARIVRRDFPCEIRLFSISALLDNRLFERIALPDTPGKRSFTFHEYPVRPEITAEGQKKAS